MITIDQSFIDYVKPAEHSKFSPSSAERWLLSGCPASIKLSEQVPPAPSSKYAVTGTLAHDYCEHLVLKKLGKIEEIPNRIMADLLGEPDMGAAIMEHAESYYDVVSYWMNNKETIGDLIFFDLEKSIPIFPDKGCFGTADAIVIGTKGAAIIDYKNGRKPVPADSPQLRVYASGVSRWIQNPPKGYTFTCVIYQPNVDEIPKEHTYTGTETWEFLDYIWKSIENALSDDPICNEGPHCFWCPINRNPKYRHLCPAKRDKAESLAQENFKHLLAGTHKVEDITVFSPERDRAIIKIMKLFPAIKEVYDQGVEEFLMRMEEGEVIPGLRIKEIEGRRALIGANDAEKAQLIREKFPGIEPMEVVTKTKLKSISAMEKVLGKNKLDIVCQKKITKEIEIINDDVFDVVNNIGGFAKLL